MSQNIVKFMGHSKMVKHEVTSRMCLSRVHDEVYGPKEKICNVGLMQQRQRVNQLRWHFLGFSTIADEGRFVIHDRVRPLPAGGQHFQSAYASTTRNKPILPSMCLKLHLPLPRCCLSIQTQNDQRNLETGPIPEQSPYVCTTFTRLKTE
jgi:hypothetical protein